MFDARLRPLIDPPLNAMGRKLARLGIGANAVTLAGIIPALAAAFAIAHHHYLAGLALVLLNRLIDGLDGAVARASGLTDFGGYLDTLADYVFYVAVPVGFGLAAVDNAIAALLLVASFTLTCASFLVFAALAAKRGRQSGRHGTKSFFYSTGLAEGAGNHRRIRRHVPVARPVRRNRYRIFHAMPVDRGAAQPAGLPDIHTRLKRLPRSSVDPADHRDSLKVSASRSSQAAENRQAHRLGTNKGTHSDPRELCKTGA
ncbi:CDP-alcohol phosphatidyltransferase family protein [Novosphingobium sp.]|uniref:CDP-alcohol phosphatidyltransferase family protein n=1 Tax=Novosphingobium sp. TaxID=1874826 RepID=UPI0025F51966|nr:CDP-alcohol phosphatidyltransferase family protein [Novosphingobium sp.]